MMKFIGKDVGDVLIEYYGPVRGRNYNVSGAAAPTVPTIHVQVFGGTGAIQVQETQTFMIKGNAGTNMFTHDKLADPATWVNIGPVITIASGLITVVPTIDSSFSSIRVIMATAGSGHAVVQSEWR